MRYYSAPILITAWIILGAFTILLNLAYVNLILPLFNTLVKLPEGRLHREIVEAGRQAGFPVEEITVMDGSKRTTKANAFLSGFGKAKKIVLFDTLLTTFSVREMAAVVAHELGHHAYRHIYLNMVNALLQLLLFLYLLSTVIFLPAVAEAVGVKRAEGEEGIKSALHVTFYIALELLGPLSVLTSLFSHACSRLFEYQADEFSVRSYSPSPLPERVPLLKRDKADESFRASEKEKREKREGKKGEGVEKATGEKQDEQEEGEKKQTSKEKMEESVSKLMKEVETRGEVEDSDKKGQALKRALSLLSASHLDNLTPHPLYVFFHYTHPPILNRLEAIDKNVKKLM
uniref:Peptidase M48 domain-containing protein n=1 Tax=Palpitomonas bilix TaxID=652834 RepID=A0A7S3CZ59_9EUKA|mmetsp:Transcript_13149/g.34398  ORF Transcript_13149/g.34398 Transcript_13149/m.34398 type:complete len:345 (+) Transcript_13149:360-1394(+)